jgi:hypothetical protein
MAGSAGDPGHPRLPVRASDAEREEAVAELRERFAAGHLSHDTFMHRMETALGARDRPELAELLADLPVAGHRGPAWSSLAGLPARLAAACAPVKDAVLASARRVSATWRPDPPGLTFPAGDQFQFTIGRSPDCDLVISDITVSRRHAGLRRCLRGWLLADLGSTNGTRLNGWRVREPVPVGPGDQVSFGAVTFVFREGAVSRVG